MTYQPPSPRGFTLIELLVVIAIIGILAAVVVVNIRQVREAAYLTTAISEIRQIYNALQIYLNENNFQYPEDYNRGIPPGIEQHLSDKSWDESTWPGSIYDWDNWTIDGQAVYQISVRFCPASSSVGCRYPTADWAEHFDPYSAVFYCISGDCRSHNTQPPDHPGYCINCECKEIGNCL